MFAEPLSFRRATSFLKCLRWYSVWIYIVSTLKVSWTFVLPNLWCAPRNNAHNSVVELPVLLDGLPVVSLTLKMGLFLIYLSVANQPLAYKTFSEFLTSDTENQKTRKSRPLIPRLLADYIII
jgi:hypothetical protein